MKTDYQPLGPTKKDGGSRSIIAAVVFSMAGLLIVGSFMGRNAKMETDVANVAEVRDFSEDMVGAGVEDWDTFILVDDSGSVSMTYNSQTRTSVQNDNYIHFKDFLAQWMNDGIIQENSYVGIGRFGALTNRGHGHETIPIDFTMQKMNMQSYIDNICGLPYGATLTYTDVGIHDAVEEAKTRAGRKGTRLIIVTDGLPYDQYFPCEGTGQSLNQYYTSADALAMDNVEVQIIGVTKGFNSAPMQCLVKTDSQIQVFGEFESMFEADAAEINDRMNAATKARQEVQCAEINENIIALVAKMEAVQGGKEGQNEIALKLKEAQGKCDDLDGICKLENGKAFNAADGVEISGFQYCHAYENTMALKLDMGERQDSHCSVAELKDKLPEFAVLKEAKCRQEFVKQTTVCTIHKKGFICNPRKIICEQGNWKYKAQGGVKPLDAIQCQDIAHICSAAGGVGMADTAVSESSSGLQF